MKLASGRIPTLIFVFTLIVFAIIAWLSFERLNNLINSAEKVTRINQTRVELNELLVHLINAESSQRGFLLSGDSMFLRNYESDYVYVDRLFKSIPQYLREDPGQLERFGALAQNVKKRLDYLNKTVHQDPANKIHQRQYILTGYMYMQEVYRISAEISAAENMKYEIALSRRLGYQRVTPIMLLLLSLFVIALLILSYSFIRRQLTDRIHFQKELELRIDALNRSNAELEQFAYVASHDLQEPLRKIQSFGDKLVQKNLVMNTEEGTDTVERMRSAASRMQMLINELLSFSRLSRGGIVQQFEPASLDAILRDVISDLQVIIHEKNALITIGQMPVADVIQSQIRQLFQNLISNAMKFSKSGLRPIVNVYSDIVSGYMIRGSKPAQAQLQFYRITVEDNGIGFDPQYAEKIFVIFQRLHGKLEYSGTGIGLAICRKIMANHNGYIIADGKPMEGARFYIYLPVSQAQLL